MTQKETLDLAEKIVDNGISVDVILPRKEVATIFAFAVIANVATVGLFVGIQKFVTWRETKNEKSQD